MSQLYPTSVVLIRGFGTSKRKPLIYPGLYTEEEKFPAHLSKQWCRTVLTVGQSHA
jgi:hypothetical protein